MSNDPVTRQYRIERVAEVLILVAVGVFLYAILSSRYVRAEKHEDCDRDHGDQCTVTTTTLDPPTSTTLPEDPPCTTACEGSVLSVYNEELAIMAQVNAIRLQLLNLQDNPTRYVVCRQTAHHGLVCPNKFHPHAVLVPVQ